MTWTHAIVVVGFSWGNGLVVMMWCTDGREVVLMNAGFPFEISCCWVHTFRITFPWGSWVWYGMVWWGDVCNLKNVCLLWAVTVFWSGSFGLLFLRVDCECNRPSFLAKVFNQASAFNSDLSSWDVAQVTTMSNSKSIRILEYYLTWRELMLLLL